MSSTGVYIKNLGEMIKKSFTEHMKFNLHEGDSFRDMFSNRDQLLQTYQRAEKMLKVRRWWSSPDQRCADDSARIVLPTLASCICRKQETFFPAADISASYHQRGKFSL